MNLLLVGFDITPNITTTHQKFWFEFALRVTRMVENLAVVSFTNFKSGCELIHNNGKQFKIYYLSPPAFISSDKFHQTAKFFRIVLARSFSLLIHRESMKSIIKENRINIVHFIDNFGFALNFSAKIFQNVMLSASISSLRQKSYLYDLSLFYCYKNCDSLVFFTDAIRKRLHKLERITLKGEVIKWGISPLKHQVRIPKERLRKKYNLELSKKIVLWSGFISQVKEDDFLYAIEVARAVLQSKNNCQFVFCFKPSRVKEKYYSFENNGIKIITNISNFFEFLYCGDIFLCPIANSSKSLAPPLTWIEAMASGLPVMTTNVGGANEIVINGETGYISSNSDVLSRKLLYLLENERLLSHMSSEAQKFVFENYNLEKAVEKYYLFWCETHGR